MKVGTVLLWSADSCIETLCTSQVVLLVTVHSPSLNINNNNNNNSYCVSQFTQFTCCRLSGVFPVDLSPGSSGATTAPDLIEIAL